MTTTKQIFLLLASLFIVGIGLGVTLPILPFYAERLMGSANGSGGAMALHVTGLTSVYAVMQFVFAPIWGAWSDRVGRKRMIWIGIVGSAASQILFGLSTSLQLLYGARILGGFLSGSLAPVATAYIADLSTEESLSRNMAWFGTVSSLASVAGVAFGGMISFTGFHIRAAFWHFKIDAFSMPFFAAALMMLLSALAIWVWLPESKSLLPTKSHETESRWGSFVFSLLGILVLAMAGQIALTSFEATFPLVAQRQLGYGPSQIGLGFMVCGLVMAVFQVVAVAYAAHRIRTTTQLALGFSLMGAGILMLLIARQLGSVLGAVATLALGMAFIAPNLSALAATGRGHRTGAAVGFLSAANNLGQVAGPLLGGALFAWRIEAPYAVSGILMFATACAVIALRSKMAPVERMGHS